MPMNSNRAGTLLLFIFFIEALSLGTTAIVAGPERIPWIALFVLNVGVLAPAIYVLAKDSQ
jgi:hypothetical protein